MPCFLQSVPQFRESPVYCQTMRMSSLLCSSPPARMTEEVCIYLRCHGFSGFITAFSHVGPIFGKSQKTVNFYGQTCNNNSNNNNNNNDDAAHQTCSRAGLFRDDRSTDQSDYWRTSKQSFQQTVFVTLNKCIRSILSSFEFNKDPLMGTVLVIFLFF